MIKKIFQSIKKSIRRGIQSRQVDDSGDYQTVQVESMGQIKDLRTMQQYGFYSASPLASEYIILSARNNSEDLWGLGDKVRDRFKNLKEGEVVIFNQISGSYCFFKSGGDMEVECKGDMSQNVAGIATVTASEIIINGNLTLNGNFNQPSGLHLLAGVDAVIHKHGGVQIGLDDTGIPKI